MPTPAPEFDPWEIRVRHQISRRRREAGSEPLSRPADRDLEHLLSQLDLVRAQLAAAEASRESWKREALRGEFRPAGPAYAHLSSA